MPTLTWGAEIVTWDDTDAYWDGADPDPAEATPWEATDSPLPVYRVGVVTGDSAEPTADEILALFSPQDTVVDWIEPRLSATGSFQVTISADAVGLDELVVGDRWALGDPQVVVWRDGLVVGRGFPEEPTENQIAGTVTFLCHDPIEHLNRQHIGDAERVNRADHDNWTDDSGGDTSSALTSGVTFEPSDEVLHITSSTDGGFTSDVFQMPISTTLRHTYHGSCWVRLVSGTVAIYLSRVYDGGGPGNVAHYKGDFSDDVESGEWVRYESEPIGVDATRSAEIVPKIALGPNSEVYVASAAQDGSKVFRIARDDVESVAAGGDVGTLVGTLLQYPIDNLQVPVRRRSWTVGHTLVDGHRVRHAEHRTVWAAISDWLHEVDVRFVPWRNRWESGAPNDLGGVRLALAIGPRTEGGHYGGTVAPSHASGQDVSHQPIVHGHATDDVTRDEYAPATAYTGPIWQEVIDAPDGVKPPDLPRIADEAQARKEDPTPVLQISLHPPMGGRVPGDWVSRGLWVGERFWARVDMGPKSDSALRRITRLRLVPPEGDRLEVEAVDA